MKRPILLAATCLLLVPPVAAEAASFSAASVQAVGPDPGPMSGTFVGLLVEDLGLGYGEPPPVPPFSVEGNDFTVEADRSDVAVRGAGARAGSPAETARTEVKGGSLEQVAHRPGYRVDVVPLAGHEPPALAIGDGCFELGPTDADVEEREAIVDGARPPTVLDLSRAAQLRSCGGAEATITGAFQLHFWQTDVVLRQGDDQRLLRGGSQAVASPEGAPSVHAGPDEEYYVLVRDGTLRLPLASNVRLYASGLSGDLVGTVVLTDARGYLDTAQGRRAVEDRALVLRGAPLGVEVEGRGQGRLQVTLDGWGEARVGEQTFDPQWREAAGAPSVAGPLAVLVLCLAAAARRSRAGWRR